MPGVHVLLKKEEIETKKLADNKIAVVFDVLLATSAITSALYYGAKEVIPVLNKDEALIEAAGRPTDETILVGEMNGKPIEGFMVPHPAFLKKKIENKSIILSTTNGTVAIRKASSAKKLYIGSILNGRAVAEAVLTHHPDEAVVIICSGSSGAFCLEDFYGAGYFLDCLVGAEEKNWELTDAARAALLFYRGTVTLGDGILKSSSVGRWLVKYGLEDVVEYVTGRGTMPIAPFLAGEKRIIRGD
ncbi:MAG: 2-phosphosulfolactate phosphatase [Tuberibacillus sp.]